MAHLDRQVFVISDLHLGGDRPSDTTGTERGFRLNTHTEALADFIRALAERPREPMTELVINGDLVDFLAERHDQGRPWRPFHHEPEVANRLLERIVSRDRTVFDALRAFLTAGHRLVILLGNHDIELALPAVRGRLRQILEAQGKDFELLHDGEAYAVGDAVIEHGNEYDSWNRVNYAQLRRLRAAQSRHEDFVPAIFEPPPGSRMVADVINPIKETYGFIDLLKPETSAALPLLLALEPGLRSKLSGVAKQAYDIGTLNARRRIARSVGGDIAARETRNGLVGGDLGTKFLERGRTDPVGETAREVLGDNATEFLAALEVRDEESGGAGGDIGLFTRTMSDLSFARLLLSRDGPDDHAMDRRLPLLLQAIRGVQDDRSFDRTTESAETYRSAAEHLLAGSTRYVVFGHTHLAKAVELQGGTYVNSGTWSDILEFPRDIITGSTSRATRGLRSFVDAMRRNDFSAFTTFRPTYVRLDMSAQDRTLDAELVDYASI